MAEQALTFPCQHDTLIGIYHPGSATAGRGVLVVVGGPQYRVGSHRQFVLLARALAAAGIPCLRFDYRGMGDAEGESRDFNAVGDDIKTAVDQLFQCHPRLTEVVIWGLCDAASAALFYAWRDSRVRGLVLLNPWVRTEAGIAKTYLKNYYLKRFLQADLWRKMLRGQFDFRHSLFSLTGLLRQAAPRAKMSAPDSPTPPAQTLPERMATDFGRFDGAVAIILSGNDLTAAEFSNTVRSSAQWRQLLAAERVSHYKLAQADHTFSRRQWRDRVAEITINWLQTF